MCLSEKGREKREERGIGVTKKDNERGGRKKGSEGEEKKRKGEKWEGRKKR